MYEVQIEFINSRPDLKLIYDEMVEGIVYPKIVIEEILRQRELRIDKHKKEYGCEPFATNIHKDDLIKAKVYLNIVEEWPDLWEENIDANYREDD